MDTKFCYYNNYNASQPRHFCKGCQRYWTAGGTLRNVPVGSGRRKGKIPAGAATATAVAGSPGNQQPTAGLPPAGGAVSGPFGFCPSIGRSCSPDGSSVTGLTGLTGLTGGMASPGAEVLSMSSPAVAAAAAAAAMAAASAAAAVAGSSRWGMDPAVAATDAGSNPFAAALPHGQFVPSNLPTHLPAHLPAHLPPHMAVDSSAALRQMAPSAFGGLARGSPSAFCPSTTAAPSSAPGASVSVSAGPSAHAPFPISAPVPSAWSPYMGPYPPAFAPLHPMSAQHPLVLPPSLRLSTCLPFHLERLLPGPPRVCPSATPPPRAASAAPVHGPFPPIGSEFPRVRAVECEEGEGGRGECERG
ncbi:unnamed protein product [Closterium sp. NIES-65]|nr:unnamed protein product [Closterium sp. NIES-65]